MSTVIVDFGGTITMIGSMPLDHAWYSKTGQTVNLGDLVQDLKQRAGSSVLAGVHVDTTVRSATYAALGDYNLNTLEAITLLQQRIRLHIQSPDVTGIIVTAGTNHLEEIAFLLDLMCSTEKPIIITGALKPHEALGSDGPLNLYHAIQVANLNSSSARGVLVVIESAIHSARSVMKTQVGPGPAFTSGVVGAIGTCEPDGHVTYLAVPEPWISRGKFCATDLDPSLYVPIVHTYLGSDSTEVDSVLANGASAVVIAGAGMARPAAAQREAIDRAAKSGIPVCLASRVAAGYSPRPKAASSNANVLTAGRLDPAKSRTLLLCALSAGMTCDEMRPYFEGGEAEISQSAGEQEQSAP